MSNSNALKEGVNNSPVERVKAMIKELLPELKEYESSTGISAVRFLRELGVALSQNGKLVDAAAKYETKFKNAVMQCASMGLYPDGKQVTLVPYMGNDPKIVPQIGVEGYRTAAYASGKVLAINVGIVHQKDDFKYWTDETGPHIKHEPDFFGDRGEPVGVWAVATMKGGAISPVVLTKQEVEDCKPPRLGSDSPWTGKHYLRMYEKTAVKRLCKNLPKTPEMSRVMDVDRDNELKQEKGYRVVEDEKPQLEMGTGEIPMDDPPPPEGDPNEGLWN